MKTFMYIRSLNLLGDLYWRVGAVDPMPGNNDARTMLLMIDSHLLGARQPGLLTTVTFLGTHYDSKVSRKMVFVLALDT